MEGRHHKYGFLVIIALLVAILVMSMNNTPVVNITGSGQIQRNTMSVSGNAELTVAPDKATVYINVLTDGVTAKQAQDDNKKISNNVIAALKRTGIKDDDIETSNYFLHKKTEWDPETRKSIETGYRLTHTLKVTTTDIDDVGKLLDTAVKAGANGIDRVSFGLTKELETKVRDNALKNAAVAAKDKAKSIASSTGVTLGKITSIQENNFYFTPFEYPVAEFAERSLAGGIADDSNISPQNVEVQSAISVVYEIS
tara:strand:+ start:95 stop:859 length:765 start_codon:yes stop_codon:yes gene_type:complete